MIAILFLALISSPIFAVTDNELIGQCVLKGTRQAKGWFFLPWLKEKHKFESIAFSKCIENAQSLLQKVETVEYEDNSPFAGPSVIRTVDVTIKRVNFKFKSESQVITGKIRRK